MRFLHPAAQSARTGEMVDGRLETGSLGSLPRVLQEIRSRSLGVSELESG